MRRAFSGVAAAVLFGVLLWVVVGLAACGSQTAVTPTSQPELSTTYDITEADNGKTFTYTVTSRFSVILDGNKYSPDSLSVVPTGIVGYVSNIPDVNPPLWVVRYEGVSPGTCTIRNGDFAVTVRIVSLTE